MQESYGFFHKGSSRISSSAPHGGYLLLGFPQENIDVPMNKTLHSYLLTPSNTGALIRIPIVCTQNVPS